MRNTHLPGHLPTKLIGMKKKRDEHCRPIAPEVLGQPNDSRSPLPNRPEPECVDFDSLLLQTPTQGAQLLKGHDANAPTPTVQSAGQFGQRPLGPADVELGDRKAKWDRLWTHRSPPLFYQAIHHPEPPLQTFTQRKPPVAAARGQDSRANRHHWLSLRRLFPREHQ
jgi:hypothetical protein